MRKLLLREFVAPDEWFHVARATTALRVSSRNAIPHTHDFAEVFWVESGRGVHLVNGQRQPLQRGDVVLMRPEDTHIMVAAMHENDDDFVIANVAFAADTLEFLRERYFSSTSWLWQGTSLPAHYVVGQETLRMLSAWADNAPSGHQTRLDLEAFLLELLRRLTWSRSSTSQENTKYEGASRVLAGAKSGTVPQWLEHTLIRFDDPRYLAAGGEKLAQLAGRCPEHVNRVLRSATGRTTTSTVNEMRLQFVARQLRLTNRPVGDIAADCGFTNPSHFHRVFRERFGTSPRRFRVREQATVS